MKDVRYNYSTDRDVEWFRERFNIEDPRTWPFSVITMPVNKDGAGPCNDDEIDHIVYEVWDQLCDSYGSHEFLPDAIAQAIKMSYELISEKT